jgi:hypothetical protein
MAAGRATIGAESGASALDLRGEMQSLTDDALAAEPGLTFEQFAARMPKDWDAYRFFAVSPRHLEAVVTKTAQILVEGEYSGVLQPARHYLPVRRDFSNLDDVLESARDQSLLAEVAEQAYQDVYLSGRYSSRRLTEALQRMLAENAVPRERRRPRFRGVTEKLAAAEGELERRVVVPIAGVYRVGRDGYGEILAGLRLIGTDPVVRRLLWDYLRSTEARNHVGPRQALGELLTLGALRRATVGKFDGGPPFAVSVHMDEARQRVVLTSHPHGNEAAAEPLSRERLRELLRGQGWEFLLDHSAIGRAVSYPVARGHAVSVPLRAGPSALSVLNWLARYEPSDVTAALASFVERR